VLGVAVQCPRCSASFQAVEEATLVIPGAGWVPPNPPPARTWRGPVTPPALKDEYEEEDGDEDEYEDEDDEDEQTDAKPESTSRPRVSEHDPHDESSSPLPTSVFIGLALLPFLIPIVWSITGALIGQRPMLTVGTPLALAVATSVLCLAVISTIDWTPATRIKGVLLLVILSYFTGVGLYFLKKEMVDQVRKIAGVRPQSFPDAPLGAGYRVMVPAIARDSKDPSPLGMAPLTCRQAIYSPGIQGVYLYHYGSSPLPKPQKVLPLFKVKPLGQNLEIGSDAWFKLAIEDLTKQGQLPLRGDPKPAHYGDDILGRELEIILPGAIRIVRLFVIKDRVYYLSVERQELEADDDFVREFFDSFEVN